MSKNGIDHREFVTLLGEWQASDTRRSRYSLNLWSFSILLLLALEISPDALRMSGIALFQGTNSALKLYVALMILLACWFILFCVYLFRDLASRDRRVKFIERLGNDLRQRKQRLESVDSDRLTTDEKIELNEIVEDIQFYEDNQDLIRPSGVNAWLPRIADIYVPIVVCTVAMTWLIVKLADL